MRDSSTSARLVLLAGVGFATLSGCQILDPDRGVMKDPAEASITQPAQATQPAKPIADAPVTSPISVVVHNGMGSVVVREDPETDRPEVRVRRMDDSAIKGPGHGFAGVLDAQTLTIDCPEQDGPVHVEVIVHALTDVTVRNSGGVVSIFGGSGAIDVANGTAERAGDAITVSTGHVLNGPISLGTDRGAVSLSLATGSSGVLTLRGQPMRINVLARSERMSNVRLGEGTYSAIVNEGQAEVRISAPGPVTVNYR